MVLSVFSTLFHWRLTYFLQFQLQNDLKNCFDDFIDDEDDSVNDSSHFISLNMAHSRNLARNSGLQQRSNTQFIILFKIFLKVIQNFKFHF